MAPDDICLGLMTHTAYCKITGASRGSVSGFHKAIRTKHAGILDVIGLLKPETIKVSRLIEALTLGRERLSTIGSVTPETLLYGATFYSRNQWSESLIHLWTSIEQIIERIWEEELIKSSKVDGIPNKKRKDFLNDVRSWTSATKLEVLYQKDILPDDTYALLDSARKARNKFAHTGLKPDCKVVESALEGLFQLSSLRITNYKEIDVLNDIVEMVRLRGKLFTDWDRTGEPIEGVTHWLALPPLPGDEKWGDEPFEIIEELQLKPIERDDA